jgi:hypothetical protein
VNETLLAGRSGRVHLSRSGIQVAMFFPTARLSTHTSCRTGSDGEGRANPASFARQNRVNPFASQVIQGSSPFKTAQGTGLLPDSRNMEATA